MIGLTDDTVLTIEDKRNGVNDGTDKLLNIEYVQFADQIVEESKVDVYKTYSSNFSNYSFYNNGNGIYKIKNDNSFDDITGIPKLVFSDKTVSAIVDIKGTFDQITGLNTNSGYIFRLYTASFNRFPDPTGLNYWIEQLDTHNDLQSIAISFLNSAEFKNIYGNNVTDEVFVNNLYKNVLGREADAEGLLYWVNQLEMEFDTRDTVLLGFSESQENKVTFSEMTGY